MNYLKKNAGHLGLLLISFLFIHLSAHSQIPVAYTVDQSTTGDSLIRAFGLPNGKSGVLSFNVNHSIFCTIVNSDGSVANSFDITSKLTLQQPHISRLQFNAVGTPNGNIFIVYTAEGTDNLTNQNALYLVLNQSSGSQVASGIVNTSNQQGGVPGLNRYPNLAVLSNGNVVVTWEIFQQVSATDLNASPSTGSGIFRIFTEAGVAVTGEIIFAGPGSSIFSSVVSSQGYGVRIAANSGGGFLIFFDNYNVDNMRAIRFDNNGTVQQTGGANTFVVEQITWTGNFRVRNAVGLANGNYLLFWSYFSGGTNTGYYKVISAAGADVSARMTVTDAYLAKEVKNNGWVEAVAVNTAGKQGFAMATDYWQNYDDLTNPYMKVKVYNYDLSGTFLSTFDLTSDFIANDHPVLSFYSGLPSGVGVAYQTFKTFTVTNGRVDFPTDADVKGATLDFDQPSVSSITRKTPATATTNATSVTYQVVFSTSVTGVDASDFSLTATGGVTGTIGTISGSGTTYSVSVGSITGNGTLRLDLKSSGIGIVSGGGTAIASGFATGDVYTFDHTVPTLSPVTIVSNNATTSLAKVGDVITVGFTASEHVSTPVVTIAGHSATITAGSGNSYTASYTMTNSDAEGVVPFTINVTDDAGNASVQATATTNSSSVTFDRTSPTVTINQAATQVDPTTGMTIHFTVVFSEPVASSFTSSDITLSGTVGGTLAAVVSELAPNNHTTYDVAVTGMASTGGTVIAAIDAGKAFDGAGNGNTVSTSIDNTVNWLSDVAPTVVSSNRQVPAAQLTNAATVTFRVVFSEDVTGVDASDFTLSATGTTSGTVGTVTPVDAKTYDVALSSISGDGTIRLDVNSSGTGIKDIDGVTQDDLAGGFTSGQTYTIDQTPPTLSAVTIASTNANPAYAKVGDEVALLFTSSEPIQTPTVTILGGPATVIPVTGNQWKATYTVQSTDAPEGVVAFSIAFADIAGNNGTNVTATSNSSSVTFDQTAPTLTSVTIASNNTNSAYAKVGDVVTVSFTASESIQTPVVTIAARSATVSHGSGDSYTATYAMATGDAEGLVPFTIDFGDLAGNSGVAVSATTNSSSVTFDKTLPTLAPVTIASNNTNSAYAKVGDVVTVSFTASEGIQTPSVGIAGHNALVVHGSGASYTATYTMTSSDAEGTVAFTVAFLDVAGNAGADVSGTTNSSQVTFDHTAPTLSPVTLASNNATATLAKPGDVVSVTFTSGEAINTPTATIATHNGTITPQSGNSYIATYTMTSSDAEGVVPFSISISDLAGNTATVTTTTNSNSVTFDKTAPTATSINRFDPTVASTTATTLTYQATFTEGVSGVDALDFTLVATSPAAGSITSVTPVSSTVYNITVNVTSAGGGALRLDLKSSGTGITDATGNAISGGFTGQSYTLGTPPSFTNCPTVKTVNTDAGLCSTTLTKATLLSYVAVTGDPTPTLTVKVGTATVTTSYTFPKGNTTVTVSAANGLLPNATCSFTVTVVDNQPPVIHTITRPIVLLWSPNHKYQTIKASQFVSSITDNCGNLSTGSVVITKVTSDEPDDIPGNSDGSTTQDIKMASNCTSVDLRSERQDGSNGRVYTIYLKATDAKGNIGTAIAYAIVPVNQKGTTAIDSGPAYTVYSNCNTGTNVITMNTAATEQKVQELQGLQVQALPNPSSTYFTLVVRSNDARDLMLQVFDEVGRRVEGRTGIASNTTLRIGTTYRPGVYYAQVLQGGKMVTVKLIKQID